MIHSEEQGQKELDCELDLTSQLKKTGGGQGKRCSESMATDIIEADGNHGWIWLDAAEKEFTSTILSSEIVFFFLAYVVMSGSFQCGAPRGSKLHGYQILFFVLILC